MEQTDYPFHCPDCKQWLCTTSPRCDGFEDKALERHRPECPGKTKRRKR